MFLIEKNKIENHILNIIARNRSNLSKAIYVEIASVPRNDKLTAENL